MSLCSLHEIDQRLPGSLLAELEWRSDSDAICEGVAGLEAVLSQFIDQARTTDRAFLIERFVSMTSVKPVMNLGIAASNRENHTAGCWATIPLCENSLWMRARELRVP